MPNNFPPWEMVYQQTQRWLRAGCFESMVCDLCSISRVPQGQQGQPSAVILDGRTMQSTCESGPRAGYDGYKRKRGSKVHIAVDTLGHLLRKSREKRSSRPSRIKDTQAKTLRRPPAMKALICRSSNGKSFVLLPRRWVVERSFGWRNRFRRLARDYERLPETLAGLHFMVFAMLMLVHAVPVLQSS